MKGHHTNRYAHLTAKEREGPSFPTRWLLRNGLLKGRVLDFGCGLGADARFLKGRGLDVSVYDPYYLPTYPEGRFGTVLCHYVLNVLEQTDQADVVMRVSELVGPGGSAFFTVRRDIVRDGYRIHKLHGKPTYQCHVRLPFASVFANESCEIYHYRPYTELMADDPAAGPFLQGGPRELLTESATFFAIADGYPVSPGHSLVVPKRVVPTFFDLTGKEQMGSSLVLARVQKILAVRYAPDGFNVGFNAGPAAGQTVPHAHIHVIPRYHGDVPDPRGGIRGVIPGKRVY